MLHEAALQVSGPQLLPAAHVISHEGEVGGHVTLAQEPAPLQVTLHTRPGGQSTAQLSPAPQVIVQTSPAQAP